MTLGIPLGLERAERRDQEDVWTWVLQVPCRPVGLYIPIEFAMHATVLGMIAPRCHLLVPGVIPARAFAALGGLARAVLQIVQLSNTAAITEIMSALET